MDVHHHLNRPPPQIKCPARDGGRGTGRIEKSFCGADHTKLSASGQGGWPELDHDLIDALFPSATELDAARDHRKPPLETHVLPYRALANVSIDEHMNWIDHQTGVEGVGAVALVAHKLSTSPSEAAYRLARYYCAWRPNFSMSTFVEKEPCHA